MQSLTLLLSFCGSAILASLTFSVALMTMATEASAQRQSVSNSASSRAIVTQPVRGVQKRAAYRAQRAVERPHYGPRPLTIRRHAVRKAPERPLKATDYLCPRADDPKGRCVAPSRPRQVVRLGPPGAQIPPLGGATLGPPQVPPVDYTQSTVPPFVTLLAVDLRPPVYPDLFGRGLRDRNPWAAPLSVPFGPPLAGVPVFSSPRLPSPF